MCKDRKKNLKIMGIVENVCKQCGEKFKKAYYEGETEENGKGDYCIFCILGIPRGSAERDEINLKWPTKF